MTNVLIVDDDVTFCLMLKTLLQKNQYRATTVFSPTEAHQLIRKHFYEVVLTDLRMPDINGIELIHIIKNLSPKTQIIMMTGYADITTAIQSIKQGAFNYISKPFLPEELLTTIREALEHENKTNGLSSNQNSGRENNYLEGTDISSKRLKKHIKLVAPTPMSVLITGESGTGKEHIARSIHALSQRSQKPFIAVDCGAIPKELVASEFFGHVKGSFTGAFNNKTGHFEAAHEGTLFLDEVGNLPYNTQIQLLRTLQERKIKPIGSQKEVPVDVRILAATNEDLKKAKKEARFREDLYHRLNEFQIEVPPLRERQDDILLFAQYFMDQANICLSKSISGFTPEVEAVFKSYNWPGNLREMKNIVKRAVLLTANQVVSLKEIPTELQQSKEETLFHLVNEDNEIEMIQKVLKMTHYNKSQAARVLNIDRKTLYNKLDLYDIKVPSKNKPHK